MGKQGTSVLVVLLPVLVTFLITSGLWIGIYYIAGLDDPQNNIVNNYCGSNASEALPTIPTGIWYDQPFDPLYPNQCEATGTYSTCTEQCEFVICESIPDDLYPGQDFNTTSTTDCWLRLFNSAENEIVIGSYYWTLLLNETDEVTDDMGYSADGLKIYNALIDAATRNISIRIAMSAPTGDNTYNEPYAIRDVNPSKVGVRGLDFPAIMGHGILHTKSISVDGKHLYVGSANVDWRSMTQVKEIGIATFNCDCLAEDVQRMIDILWYMGAQDAVIPSTWPSQYATNANHFTPYVVPRQTGPSTAVYFSSSPPPFNACGRENDIDTMVRLIDEAQEFVYLAVMDYAPATLYNTPNSYYGKLDDAIRRAAFDRSVQVYFMMSKWSHTSTKLYSYLHALDDFEYDLQCQDYSPGCTKGEIIVKIFEIPDAGYESIPYTRVQHTKYFVTEKAAYIGKSCVQASYWTSNWSADYWEWTSGFGMVIKSADSGSQEALVAQLKSLYLRDYNSKYATPIWDYSISGKLLNTTSATGARK